MATNIADVLTPDNVLKAQVVLGHMVMYGSTDVNYVIDTAFSDPAEREAMRKQVADFAAEQGMNVSFRAWLGGTGQLLSNAGYPAEIGQPAIQILKHNKNILQLGRGRGKAVVLIHNELPSAEQLQAKLAAELANAKPARKRRTKAEIAADKEAKENQTPTVRLVEDEGPADVPRPEVPDAFIAVVTQYNTLLQENETNKGRAEEAEQRVTELEGQMALLQRKVNEQALTGWQ